MFVTPKKASKHFCVCQDTLRRWAETGQIEYNKTKGGQRRYKIPFEKEDPPDQQPGKIDKQRIIYARVSSRKQSEDLKRQIAYISQGTDTYPIEFA